MILESFLNRVKKKDCGPYTRCEICGTHYNVNEKILGTHCKYMICVECQREWDYYFLNKVEYRASIYILKDMGSAVTDEDYKKHMEAYLEVVRDIIPLVEEWVRKRKEEKWGKDTS